jgi:hypothetical protein
MIKDSAKGNIVTIFVRADNPCRSGGGEFILSGCQACEEEKVREIASDLADR